MTFPFEHQTDYLMNGLHRSHLAVGDKELVTDSFEGSRKQKAHRNSYVSTNNSRHYCSFILVGCGMENLR
ncbi:hypothetical protein TNCT_409961 [Trichonephila clavata]|uniref:Uncharacterized protein n=1 Tax=Trichonephila clavata TaxID=2740835 RepID=A0A8X6L7N0_TRICU|nr:hypothetical protein TNCT_409961 [Trichonephila clavata]